jgi:hypothetical protein
LINTGDGRRSRCREQARLVGRPDVESLLQFLPFTGDRHLEVVTRSVDVRKTGWPGWPAAGGEF